MLARNSAKAATFHKFKFNMKNILFLILLGALTMTSCVCKGRVNPGEWVVTTATCWNTYSITKAGAPIPRLLTTCDRMIVLPATEMSADFVCETKFANRVAGDLAISYQWTIEDPMLFIQSAKSITSSSTSTYEKMNPDVIEAIENTVVDKALRDIVREYTPTIPAGTDEKVIEDKLEELVERETESRGVRFSSMSVNVNYDPQTEEALGVLSALLFYKANGEEELGRQVILRKAGAANIETHNTIPINE